MEEVAGGHLFSGHFVVGSSTRPEAERLLPSLLISSSDNLVAKPESGSVRGREKPERVHRLDQVWY